MLPRAFSQQPFAIFGYHVFTILNMLSVNALGGLVLSFSVLSSLAAVRSSPQALNPQLTNTIPDNGGPILHYNGSGPVPP